MCDVEYPVSEFYSETNDNSRGKRRVRLRTYCKGCTVVWHRNHRFKKKYGITVDEYDDMLARQHGACAICGDPKEKLHIDHSHETGKVRGLLCMPCNTALGFFRDDPALLDSASIYIETR